MIVKYKFIALIKNNWYQNFSLLDIYKNWYVYKIRFNKKIDILSKIFGKIEKV